MRWHFGAKQVKGKLTNRITEKVKTEGNLYVNPKDSEIKNNNVQPVHQSQARQTSTVWRLQPTLETR